MKKPCFFSEGDIRQIRNLGVNPADVENQLAAYRRGSNYLKLVRPCDVQDGIVLIKPVQKKKLIDLYERDSRKYKLIKFVPASGAASRMFSEWFTANEKGSFGSDTLDQKFFRDLDLFPFSPLIKQNEKGNKLVNGKDINGLLEFILGKDGLDYGNKPKALIPFHKYPAGRLRTALEEHLLEAARYLRSANGICHLHFTIAQEHKKEVNEHLKKIRARYETICRLKFKISSSIQPVSTNTIAVNENNLPLRNANKELVFRPGGHGALLANLNNLDADFIFVKNIDNVAPDTLLEKILPFKKMLGGMAVKIQEEISAIMLELEAGETTSSEIDKFVKYCSQTLNIVFQGGFRRQTKEKRIQTIFSILNRPLRICGMVKNAGEPGGGPFWVEEKDGTQTLQIVEKGHVDNKSSRQLAIWSQAKYFNPVDMVLGVRNYRGEKFILDNYVNKDACLITEKNEKGIVLKALELPGLWNGGMAYWNTVFVELPLIVFNPVKTVYDLLRPEHAADL